MRFTSSNLPLLVISGPSGSGKSTAVSELVKEGLVEITPTWTTRPPRSHEKANAIEHVFVTDEEFDEKERQGFFLESATMFGLPYRYGLPHAAHSMPGRIPLVMLRAPLLGKLSKYYNTVTVYQVEDTLERVKARLAKREREGESLGTRLKDYEKEVRLGRKLAKRVFVNNTTIIDLVDQLASAIREDFK